MKIELADALWLDKHQEVAFAELAQWSGLSEAELRELVDCGALVPIDAQSAAWSFGGECLVTVRTARRLRDDLELDPHALALALMFLDRIRRLEAQLRELQAQLPQRFP
jgi:chaperone modulatory protein CbpM